MDTSVLVLVVLCSIIFLCVGLFSHAVFSKYRLKKRQVNFAQYLIKRLDKDRYEEDKTSAYQMVREFARLNDLNTKDDIDFVNVSQRKLQVMNDMIEHGRECNSREKALKAEPTRQSNLTV